MNINVDKQLGKRLWDYRKELKLTREVFFEKCGICAQFLYYFHVQSNKRML